MPTAREGTPADGTTSGERLLRVGFIPLTDCAPLLMAVANGHDRRHGIRIALSREPSWAAIRDKLLTGELDAAHALYGLVYGVQAGIGGLQRDLAVLMTLNRNGQAITLSRRLHADGAGDGAGLAALVRRDLRRYTFAQTFPTGNHALLLYYWLAAHGIHPFRDINNVVLPPPQMQSNLAAGNIDGFCAGEPWNAEAVSAGSGFTVATSQAVWPDHPEKVLASTRSFVSQRPDDARALIMAVLQAARELESDAGRRAAAAVLSGPGALNVPAGLIGARLDGRYDDGVGRQWTDPNPVRFFADGEVNYPWPSDGMWFLTQHRRWGLIDGDPDYAAVVAGVQQTELYRQAAGALGVSVPSGATRVSVLCDGTAWAGRDPAAYAGGFAIGAAGREATASR